MAPIKSLIFLKSNSHANMAPDSQVRAPRFRPCSCLVPHDTVPASRLMALMAGRATPELERVQAELGARLSFREASPVLDLFVPATRPHNHKSVRNRLARVADHIETKDLSSPHRMSRVGPGPMSVFIDGAYIRPVPGFQTRHFEIIMGCVDTDERVARLCVRAKYFDEQGRYYSSCVTRPGLDSRQRHHSLQRWRSRAQRRCRQRGKTASHAYSRLVSHFNARTSH